MGGSTDSRMSKKSDKTQLLKVIGDINKKHGAESIKFAKDEPKKERIPFGVQKIDEFIGGGVQRGNFTIVYGAERTGKSTLAYMLIASAQKRDLTCVYIDLEHSFDAERAAIFEVDLDKLILMENIETAEQAMDIVMKLCEEKVVDVIIVDSVQAMSPKQELLDKSGDSKSLEDDTMALLARKLGQFFRMSASRVYRAKVAVLMVGQVRTQGIGTFITKLGLSGGHALKHWSIMTLYMRKGQGVDAPTRTEVVEGKKEKVKVGFDCVVVLEKTKVTGSKIEGSEIHLPFRFETGFLETKEKVNEEAE